MARPRKLCRIADCPNFSPCPSPGHERKPWEGSTRSKQLPSNWPSLRRYILERDPLCTECGEHLSTEVHHKGAPDDHRPESLAGICTDCHKPITAKQAQQARAARRR